MLRMAFALSAASFTVLCTLVGCGGEDDEEEGNAASEVNAGSLAEGRSCGTGHKQSGVKVKPSNSLCKKGLTCKATNDPKNPSGFSCQREGTVKDGGAEASVEAGIEASVPLKENGERCRRGSECFSGRCDVAITDDKILTCLPQTTSGREAGAGEPRKPDGVICSDWTECASEICSEMSDGYRRCTSELDI